MTRVPMIQYDTCDMVMDECQRIAADLRASGKYRRVTVRKRSPELRNGEWVPFGKVYVSREDS